MMTKLKMYDCFAGIGGFSLAAEWVGGFETVAFVEKDAFCQSVLRKHWSDVAIHDDICTFAPARGSADVICGGFPCQDISQAGKRKGIEGERSGLFYELLRVVRLVEPRFVVMENVAAIVNRGMDAVLGAMAEAGYDAEWACIPASAVGACHKRDRWWCVAYPNSQRLQGLRPELELSQVGAKEEAGWSHQSTMPEQDWRCFVSQPAIRRGNDGFSGRMDRLKALGNAVVPQVATIPLMRVKQLNLTQYEHD